MEQVEEDHVRSYGGQRFTRGRPNEMPAGDDIRAFESEYGRAVARPPLTLAALTLYSGFARRLGVEGGSGLMCLVLPDA